MKLYHVSEKELDGVIVEPYIPNSSLVRNGYENGSIKRVCFCPTIDECLSALGKSLSGKRLHVYKPVGIDLKMITTEEIIKNEYVPDAHITNEIWITEPVKMKKVMTIYIESVNLEPIPYRYGKQKEKEADLYTWNWTSLEKEKRIMNPKKEKDVFSIGKTHSKMQLWESVENTTRRHH